MIHSPFLRTNETVKLFEVADALGKQNPNFTVISTYRGGMGVCYKIQSAESQNNYGLKCILPSLIEKNKLARFYDEVNMWLTASACDGIAEAISVIRFNEMPAILSPWYENGDLSGWISKLTPAYKYEMIVRAVRSLAWAHSELGIIHRDLKPANILIDDQFLTYISDWGLARPLKKLVKDAKIEASERIIDRPDRTQPGAIMGTPHYISPEQIKDPGIVDHRSDIYSLGCIMCEMETGSPPFMGLTIQEILQKHINASPPNLGGLFSTTKLGLENVIGKCLEKSPDQRYEIYEVLEEDLLSIAKKRSFSLDRCQIAERYKRYPLGKGQKAFENILIEPHVKSKDGQYGLLELEQIEPFLSESEHLIALQRFSEAEKLLRPLFIPDMLQENGSWHWGHALALNYAYCLTNIPDRIKDALVIFHQLQNLHKKPSEFYVNYSLALLRSLNYSKAEEICLEGLGKYPSDYDLLGNYTIALKRQGKLEKAYENAKKRIDTRRDVHSIEELVSVINDLMQSFRNSNLPQAIKLANQQYNLIEEGLSLNPTFYQLILFKIKLCRFINDNEKAMDLSTNFSQNINTPKIYRLLAFIEFLEILFEFKLYDDALEKINKTIHQIEKEEIRNKLLNIQMKIYADRYMIGHSTKNGERIIVKQVANYFLEKTNEEYKDPFMAARVLYWIGEESESEKVFRSLIKEAPEHWKARQELVLLLQRMDLIDEAVREAQEMVNNCPWRAESYDTLSYILKETGNFKLSKEVKEKGNEIFKKEMRLFDHIRNKY